MNKGDIYYFEDELSHKERPGLILNISGSYVIIAGIGTSSNEKYIDLPEILCIAKDRIGHVQIDTPNSVPKEKVKLFIRSADMELVEDVTRCMFDFIMGKLVYCNDKSGNITYHYVDNYTGERGRPKYDDIENFIKSEIDRRNKVMSGISRNISDLDIKINTFKKEKVQKEESLNCYKNRSEELFNFLDDDFSKLSNRKLDKTILTGIIDEVTNDKQPIVTPNLPKKITLTKLSDSIMDNFVRTACTFDSSKSINLYQLYALFVEYCEKMNRVDIAISDYKFSKFVIDYFNRLSEKNHIKGYKIKKIGNNNYTIFGICENLDGLNSIDEKQEKSVIELIPPRESIACLNETKQIKTVDIMQIPASKLHLIDYSDKPTYSVLMQFFNCTKEYATDTNNRFNVSIVSTAIRANKTILDNKRTIPSKAEFDYSFNIEEIEYMRWHNHKELMENYDMCERYAKNAKIYVSTIFGKRKV